MNPDELRRFSQNAVAQRIEKEKQFVEKMAADQRGRVEAAIADEWEKARKAISDLDNTVTNAANRGERTVVVYKAHKNIYLPRMFESKRKEHWWTGNEKIVTKYVGHIPDYAQYVCDNCPKNLKPRWITNGSSHTLELHVSW